MKHLFELGSMIGPQCKVFNGYSFVQLPGGPQIVCANYSDAKIVADIINRLAVAFEDSKENAK